MEKPRKEWGSACSPEPALPFPILVSHYVSRAVMDTGAGGGAERKSSSIQMPGHPCASTFLSLEEMSEFRQRQEQQIFESAEADCSVRV